MSLPKPLALIIMDGYGLGEGKKGNAVAEARTPNLDKLFRDYPSTLIKASGEAVGLPEGQMGNSEVGHLNLGAGRIVYQDYTRINKAVKDGSLTSNEIIQKAVKNTKNNNTALHLMGLLSDGGVHSHINHLFALLNIAKQEGLEEVYIHAITDGRDTPPQSGKRYIRELEEKINELQIGQIATVSGRYYAMDRDNRWERTKKAYDAIVSGRGKEASDPLAAIENSYQEGNSDEFVLPTVIMNEGKPVATIQDRDSVVFYNFRADRARQITRAIGLTNFKQFARPEEHPDDVYFVCMTEYDDDFNLPTAFPPINIKNGFGEIISENGLKQLRIAETEKYAHVTFFFSGGVEKKYFGEDRELLPSPKVATYDLKPEMSAYKVTDSLLGKIAEDKYDVIILNFANCDMVGHTGVYKAAVQAVETVDECLGKLVPAILEKKGQILLTADHGNSEKMVDYDGGPFTAHTTNPVPLIYIGGPDGVGLKSGKLADIAPTILEILKIEVPDEMTGESLLVNADKSVRLAKARS